MDVARTITLIILVISIQLENRWSKLDIDKGSEYSKERKILGRGLRYENYRFLNITVFYICKLPSSYAGKDLIAVP